LYRGFDDFVFACALCGVFLILGVEEGLHSCKASSMQKRWKVKGGDGKSLKPLTDTLLVHRGISSDEDKIAFLAPNWECGIHDPFLFRQMSQAVERIFRAIENGEHITIHGDYDADGVCGSAVLMTTLREIITHYPRTPSSLDSSEEGAGGRLDSYIPHRDKEGYGLNPTSIRTLHDRGTNLIITVDCGIANVEEIALAKRFGIDTIVVDHHQFGDELPDGILIHPRLPGETYPFPHLAAVGVAWKFACALCVEARRRGMEIPVGWEKWLLDFVSIATVTDMVQLVGENRVLETYGLKVMNKTRRPGLRALIKAAGYELGDIDTEAIGFGLGPRINAAGRMEHASLALRLLLAETEAEAETLAGELEEKNRERRKATVKMMGEAEKQIVGAQCIAPDQKGVMNHAPTSLIALWSSTWSPALVGLIAGKYLDRTGKPTIAIGKHGEKWIGSGRSFAEYDITAAVRIAGEGILARAGGHVQACGFSFMADDHLPLFVSRLQEHAAMSLREEDCIPMLEIDVEIALDDVSWQLIETLKTFEPFGEGNKKPLFVSRGLTVVLCDRIGKDRNHLRMTLRSPSGRTEKFIGFKLGDRASEIEIGKQIDVVYDVGINVWNGRTEIQCKMVDFHSK